jgi:lysophospholipase L1-like esterase
LLFHRIILFLRESRVQFSQDTLQSIEMMIPAVQLLKRAARCTMLALLPFLAVMLMDAATIDLSVEESDIGPTASTAIDLTVDGNMDWGIWQTTNRIPTNRMNGGSGFTSLSLIAGAADHQWQYNNSENAYSWTNGTPIANGESVTQAARAILTDNGDGVRLTLDLPSAGRYQLRFYVTTLSIYLEATSSLTNANISDTVIGTRGGKSEYTVDFITDEPDTLTLDVLRSGGYVYSLDFVFEAYTLFSFGIAPTLVTDAYLTYNNVGITQSYQVPFSNEGGGASLTIVSVTPSGEDAIYFTVDSVTSPVTAGDVGSIDFTFNPTDGERVYHTTFLITSNDPDVPTTSVDVTVLSSTVDLGKILCIGDSITEASGDRPDDDGGWSWRYPFWKNLVDYAMNNEFVGTRTSNHNQASVYPDYNGQTFINKHEAIWDGTADDHSSDAYYYLNSLKVSGDTPDTAIIFCGSNDVADLETDTAELIADRIKVIVDRLQGDISDSGYPNIRILLVSVLPRFSHASISDLDALNARYEEINSLMNAMATTESTATSRVLYLDAFAYFANRPELFWDGVNPNGEGEMLLGEVIFAALVPDRDTDGMSDAWELEYFTDLAAGVATADDDGDGVNNLDEFIYGRSPVFCDDAQLLTLSAVDSQLSFTLPAADGMGYQYRSRSYTIFSSLNLESWTPAGIGIADGNQVVFPVSFNEPNKFYKLDINLLSEFLGTGISFSGDWEAGLTGDGNWRLSQSIASDRFQRVTDPVRQGQYAARIEVRPGDDPINSSGERSEVAVMTDRNGQAINESESSGTQYYAFSVRLDPNWQMPETGESGTWAIIFQLHGPNELGTSPSFSVRVDEQLEISLHSGDLDSEESSIQWQSYPLSDGSLNRGEWIDLVFKIKFAKDFTGSVMVWRRNEDEHVFRQVLSLEDVPTLQYKSSEGSSGDHYWKFGLYRNEQTTITHILWLDGLTRGDSFDAVVRAAFDVVE